MLPEDRDFLARKERQKELLRAIEREYHLQLFKHHRVKNVSVFRKLAGWLGNHMIKWGSKLHAYSIISPPSKGV